MFKEKKILVTGGSGLIGQNLIKKLLDCGAQIRTVVGKRPLHSDIYSRVEKIQTDLSNPINCKDVMKDIQFVFHLAAFVGGVKQNLEHPATMISRNIPLNSNVIKAANDAGVEKYLYMSCGCVYPDIQGMLTEDMAWNGPPASGAIHFGWTKRMGELETRAYQDEFGLKTAIVRPSNAYGPGDLYDEYRSHVVPALIIKARKKSNPFTIWGDGKSRRDFIFVDDVVEGLLLAIEKHTAGDPINISTGISTSIKELTQKILSISENENSEILCESEELKGSSSKILSIEKSTRILNFHPKFSLDEGLKKTIDSYFSNNY